MRLGIISDTHGVLDQKVLPLFNGVDRILHAGDIGEGEVFKNLSKIAPVEAIRGNIDLRLSTRSFPDWMLRTYCGWRILMVHNLGKVGKPQPEVELLITKLNPHIVISGHSHRAKLGSSNSRIFFNPGGAGKRRFKLERTVAVLDLSKTEIRVKIHSLDQADRYTSQPLLIEEQVFRRLNFKTHTQTGVTPQL